MKVKLNEEIKEYCNILNLKGIRLHFEEAITESTDGYAKETAGVSDS